MNYTSIPFAVVVVKKPQRCECEIGRNGVGATS